jgi:histidine triad (HIT) family protein
VIPRDHYRDLGSAADADPDLVQAVMLEAVTVARAEGLDAGGYRIVTNTGREAGQSVFHLHVHVLGGRRFEWPPG